MGLLLFVDSCWGFIWFKLLRVPNFQFSSLLLVSMIFFFTVHSLKWCSSCCEFNWEFSTTVVVTVHGHIIQFLIFYWVICRHNHYFQTYCSWVMKPLFWKLPISKNNIKLKLLYYSWWFLPYFFEHACYVSEIQSFEELLQTVNCNLKL